MIHSSPSPTLHSTAISSTSPFSNRSHYDETYRLTPKPVQPSPFRSSASTPTRHAGSQSAAALKHVLVGKPPRGQEEYVMTGALAENESPSSQHRGKPSTKEPASGSPALQSSATTAISNLRVTGTKRSTPSSPIPQEPPAPDPQVEPVRSATDVPTSSPPSSNKRLRGGDPAVKLLPMQYEHCNPNDIAILISSMLMELIRYNDELPINAGHLTRFHSRAPPGISVADYLQRLTTHATLSPPILLSMVYYIDRLCALYPAFTISSLTVHRFLITSATVASKGLSDSFWTNRIYARVGGLSMKELALLELDFLSRVEWRIVPKPEVLVDYYRSLVERSEGYEIDITGKLEEEKEESETIAHNQGSTSGPNATDGDGGAEKPKDGAGEAPAPGEETQTGQTNPS